MNPFFMVYGVDAILSLEVKLPSLRISIQNEITTKQNTKLRLQEHENHEFHHL